MCLAHRRHIENPILVPRSSSPYIVLTCLVRTHGLTVYVLGVSASPVESCLPYAAITSAGIRPRSPTLMPLSAAHERIKLNSLVGLLGWEGLSPSVATSLTGLTGYRARGGPNIGINRFRHKADAAVAEAGIHAAGMVTARGSNEFPPFAVRSKARLIRREQRIEAVPPD